MQSSSESFLASTLKFNRFSYQTMCLFCIVATQSLQSKQNIHFLCYSQALFEFFVLVDYNLQFRCCCILTFIAKKHTVLQEDEKWLLDSNLPSRAVFHSQSQSSPLHHDTSAMLSILLDDSKSDTDIKYLFNTFMQSMHQLNPH